MAKLIGKITKIMNNSFQIDGKGSLNYKGNEKFKVGDVIEFHEKKGNIRDAALYVKKEEKIEEKKSEITITQSLSETNEIKPKASLVKMNSNNSKNTLNDSEIDIIELIKIERIFTNTEKLGNYVKKINFVDTDKLTISKAQFSAFENELERVNFNFYSEGIEKFIKERIKRDKATKFYKSFKSEVLDNIQELEAEFELGDLQQKYKNKFKRKFIEYLKKYYRYTLVLKEKENSIKGE